MGSDRCFLITLLNGNRLLYCALKVQAGIDDDVWQYPMEPVNREVLSALAASEAQVKALREARERWRQDAAARLSLYISLIDKNLIGDASQVRVSLIMPTLAMLEADDRAAYDWSDADALNVDETISRARKALGETE